MTAKTYEISLGNIFDILLKNKMFILVCTFLFLVIGVFLASRSVKRVVVSATIKKTKESLTDPYFTPFLKYNARAFFNLDGDLFKVVDGVIYSKTDVEHALLQTAEFKRQQAAGTMDESTVYLMSKSSEVLFDPYTDQYTIVMTAPEKVQNINLVMAETLAELQKTIQDIFKTNVEKDIKKELKRLKGRLEIYKQKDVVENNYLKSEYEASYNIARGAGVDRAASVSGELPPLGAYSHFGTKLLGASLEELKKHTLPSKITMELQTLYTLIENHKVNFETLPVFEVTQEPTSKNLEGRLQKVLIIILSSFFGMIIGVGIVLYQFASKEYRTR